MVFFAVPQLEVLHLAMENHQRNREPNGLVGEVGRPAPGIPRALPSRGASMHCWRGRGHQEGFFLKSLREVLLHRAKWITLAGFWRNVRDYLLVSHGLMMVGC